MVVTLLLFLGALVVGVLASVAGGVVGGIFVARKELGTELAATMGGAFGPVAGIGGMLIALAVIAAMGG